MSIAWNTAGTTATLPDYVSVTPTPLPTYDYQVRLPRALRANAHPRAAAHQLHGLVPGTTGTFIQSCSSREKGASPLTATPGRHVPDGPETRHRGAVHGVAPLPQRQLQRPVGGQLLLHLGRDGASAASHRHPPRRRRARQAVHRRQLQPLVPSLWGHVAGHRLHVWPLLPGRLHPVESLGRHRLRHRRRRRVLLLRRRARHPDHAHRRPHPHPDEDPIQTRPGIAVGCTALRLVHLDDTCARITSRKGISLEDFLAWNPSVGASVAAGCTNRLPNYHVCVCVSMASEDEDEETSTTTLGPTPTSTTTSATTTSTTTTGGGGGSAPPPSPVQAGITASCRRYYLAQAGDGCWAIANAAGIPLSDFYLGTPMSTRAASAGACGRSTMCASALPGPSRPSRSGRHFLLPSLRCGGG